MANLGEDTRQATAATSGARPWAVKLMWGLAIVLVILAALYGVGWLDHRPASLDDAARAPSAATPPAKPER
jgi:hypothetical protein